MSSQIAMLRQSVGVGPVGIVATYSLPQPVRVYRIPDSQALTVRPAAFWEPTGKPYDEVRSGLPEDEFAVINGLATVQARPGAKSIQLNVRSRNGEPGTLSQPVLLHVHLLETVSRLRYDGPIDLYEIAVRSD